LKEEEEEEEEKDIAGEFVYPPPKVDNNMTKEIMKQENQSPVRSPSSKSRRDKKKEMKLKLNVEEAAKHNMKRNWSQHRNNLELLTPGSRGTPKRK